MLTNLFIKNYALIREFEMQPDPELSIITGETGAGKSIMLGAIGLLLGNRADTRVLYDEGEKCVIEGTFDVPDHDSLIHIFEEEELDYDATNIIRREISPSGKSRAFVNDTPVTLETLRKIGNLLVDVHSQHDTLQLGSNEYQLYIIDTYAQNQTIQNDYRQAYRLYKKHEHSYEDLVANADTLRKELDYNKFLLDELAEADLTANEEQEMLEDQLKMLENAEEIKTKLNTAIEIITNSEYAVNTNLRQIGAILGQLSNLSSKYTGLKERVESCLIELRDVASELETEEVNIEFDPERINQIQERLSMIYRLQKKHNVESIQELLSIQEVLEAKVGKVLNFDDAIAEAKKQMDKSFEALMKIAQKLSATRTKVISSIEKELMELLKDVGMPNATVSIQHDVVKPIANGIDSVNLRFSANKGMKPQELKSVASGGEFSRLMLCVKYLLADKTSLPTIIFDEIDTGISGEVAIKVGRMIKRMAQAKHQVLAISHLHQIAAKGNVHYFVYKDNSAEKTVSKIKKLSEQERINEIAKMIGGENPSESAIKNAKELLETA
ncbi:DNA repair protein RecN [Xanthocytophaga agilis]|uniref:DNA repair protein RecN n=1 Tax=Xanthocytophaga agilis TaxID=3048010 RepID=A0AAE3UCG5_9BACT|nr:DNA repair protein RecN [Xanthocytophaga agilis]MDJ1500863.1 DNA repair protein RecN [Xanthocytophaga agilis]